MSLLDRLRGLGGMQPEPANPDQKLACRLLSDLDNAVSGERHTWKYHFEREFEPILATPREVHSQVVLELLAHRRRWGRKADWDHQRPAHELLNILLRRKLPFDQPALALATGRFARNRPYHASEASFVGLLERCLPEGATEPAMLEALKALADSLGEGTQQHRLLHRRIDALRGGKPKDGLEAGEAWSDRVLADLSEMPASASDAWQRLLDHAATATSARPSKKWLGHAAARCEAIRGAESADTGAMEVERLTTWFALVSKPKELATVPGGWSFTYKPPVSDVNAVYLRGLVWAASQIDSAPLQAAVARLAEVCFAKIPDFGAVNRKVGNACIWALGNSPSLDGVAWLARLQSSVRYPSARTLIAKATTKAAERAGVTAQEIEEIAVPDFGLGPDGTRRQVFGEWTAVLELLANGKTAITWHTEATASAKAKRQKSVPKAVKEEFGNEIKALKAEARTIQKLLPGQRARFEGFYLDERAWPLATWKERYLDHPFTGHLARRLIWLFESAAEPCLACWLDGQLVDVEGRAAPIGEDARVSLWHPLGSEVEDVRAWRRFLTRHGITQPFKQAHREVYILTEAEVETGVYSNRFAAHILKQHQLANLLTARGWHYTLQGAWDSHNVPFRTLERHGLEAQFWVEAIAMEDVTPAGIFLYVSSDQVCFSAIGEDRRLPLTEVSALVFSEVMRDVDLLVSVSSLGADSTWSDDRRHEFAAYWTEFAFGDLRANGESRRELLVELLPSLAAAQSLSIEGKWLVVEGHLHRYRIHLGSGSIQMDPGGHVCIVPAPRRAGVKLRLPYEGDSLLSIILSKALLLLRDDKIEDMTIQRQIR